MSVGPGCDSILINKPECEELERLRKNVLILLFSCEWAVALLHPHCGFRQEKQSQACILRRTEGVHDRLQQALLKLCLEMVCILSVPILFLKEVMKPGLMSKPGLMTYNLPLGWWRLTVGGLYNIPASYWLSIASLALSSWLLSSLYVN